MRHGQLAFVMSFWFVTVFGGSAAVAHLPVVWQSDLNGMSRNEISGLELTPGGGELVVFHFTGATTATVEKVDPSTGAIIWSRAVTKSRTLSTNGWVDGEGNIYLLSQVGGHRLWKHDPELYTEIWEYTNYASGFEYVLNVITDDAGNVYAVGYSGSGSGQGSRVVKLDSLGTLVWDCLSLNTSGKDVYGSGVALDSSSNLFRVGRDRPAPATGANPNSRGRLIGHSAIDGEEFLNYLVPEANSQAMGVVTDADDNLYVAYCHNLFTQEHTSTEQELTVIQKLDQQGELLWEYRFDDVGMFLPSDALIRSEAGSLYLAFMLRQGADVYPGLAEFDLDGNLLWQDTIDRPNWGWPGSSAFDSGDGLIYAGLANSADWSETQVLAIVPFIDCNGNSVHDVFNLAEATSEDCNANGKPDECDITEGASKDCNTSGIPDECELIGDECPYQVGDVNNDGQVSRPDTLQFILVLLGLDHCPCSVAAADINGDGQVTGLDVRPFIRLLRCNLGLPMHDGGYISPIVALSSFADEAGIELDLGVLLDDALDGLDLLPIPVDHASGDDITSIRASVSGEDR